MCWVSAILNETRNFFNKLMQLTHTLIHTKKIGLPKFWYFLIPGCLMLKTPLHYLNAFVLHLFFIYNCEFKSRMSLWRAFRDVSSTWILQGTEVNAGICGVQNLHWDFTPNRQQRAQGAAWRTEQGLGVFLNFVEG